MAKVLSRPKSICMDKSALSHRCIPPLGSFHIATPLCNKARYTSPAHEFARLEVAAVAGDVGAGDRSARSAGSARAGVAAAQRAAQRNLGALLRPARARADPAAHRRDARAPSAGGLGTGGGSQTPARQHRRGWRCVGVSGVAQGELPAIEGRRKSRSAAEAALRWGAGCR
jgi:hypothetical protein